jgi:hypothetical protein
MRATLVFVLCFSVLAGVCSASARPPAEEVAIPTSPPGCAARTTTELPLLDRFEQQSLVVEVYGECRDAMVAIWADRMGRHDTPGSVQVLHLARLSDFGVRAPDPLSTEVAVHSILERVEMDGSRYVETWAALQRAGDQPDGAPWRGTPLSRSEYQRVTTSSPRFMLIPTDGARAKLVAWDDANEVWVDVIYYGD